MHNYFLTLKLKSMKTKEIYTLRRLAAESGLSEPVVLVFLICECFLELRDGEIKVAEEWEDEGWFAEHTLIIPQNFSIN